MQRTETDSPIGWAVTAWLMPATPRDQWDEFVREIVKAARVKEWSGADADLWAHEYQAARDAARDPKEFGWFAHTRDAYVLQFNETAPTRTTAIAQAKTRLDLPEGWGVTIEAEPAG
jgi:hypothetical protein